MSRILFKVMQQAGINFITPVQSVCPYYSAPQPFSNCGTRILDYFLNSHPYIISKFYVLVLP